MPLSSGSESEEVEDDNTLHFPTAGVTSLLYVGKVGGVS